MHIPVSANSKTNPLSSLLTPIENIDSRVNYFRVGYLKNFKDLLNVKTPPQFLIFPKTMAVSPRLNLHRFD